MNNENADNNVLGSLQLTGDITDVCDEDFEQDGITKVKRIDKISINGCIKHTIEFTNMN